MKSSTTPNFWTSYRKLPTEIKSRARTAYRLWRANPRHPSLRFKIFGELRSIFFPLRRILKTRRVLSIPSFLRFAWKLEKTSILKNCIWLNFWKMALYFWVSPWIVFRLRFKETLRALKAQHILSPGQCPWFQNQFLSPERARHSSIVWL